MGYGSMTSVIKTFNTKEVMMGALYNNLCIGQVVNEGFAWLIADELGSGQLTLSYDHAQRRYVLPNWVVMA